jgi:hypothetical protein
VGLFLPNLAILHADFNPADISAFVQYDPDHYSWLPGGADRIEETSGRMRATNKNLVTRLEASLLALPAIVVSLSFPVSLPV